MKSPDTALKLLALALLGAVVAASSTLLGADIFTDTNEFEAAFSCLARIMHKFSTASPKSLVLTVLGVTRGATHSGRRFRRFVTRTYAESGLGADRRIAGSWTLGSQIRPKHQCG